MTMSIPMPFDWIFGFDSRKEPKHPLLEFFTQEELDTFNEVGRNAVDVVSPLTRVHSSEQLRVALEVITPKFISTNMALFSSFTRKSLTNPRFAEEMDNFAYERLYEAVRGKKDLLGEEQYDVMFNALESSRELDRFITQSITENRLAELLTTFMRIGQEFIFVPILKAAIAAIVMDVISDWEMDSIPLLIAEFDARMTDIEDIFFDASPSQGTLDEDSVSYQDIVQAVGL